MSRWSTCGVCWLLQGYIRRRDKRRLATGANALRVIRPNASFAPAPGANRVAPRGRCALTLQPFGIFPISNDGSLFFLSRFDNLNRVSVVHFKNVKQFRTHRCYLPKIQPPVAPKLIYRVSQYPDLMSEQSELTLTSITALSSARR